MPFEIHTVEALDGAPPLNGDRVIIGVLLAQPLSGTSNGTVTVSGLNLPANYGVVANINYPSAPSAAVPSEAVYGKSTSGFTVMWYGTTPANATADILIFA